ncbi:MAG TPA: GNAT family N-acetyltransferase [Solirubrobacteraceae bacterium]|nr:GNAT family N-acetyltransferase [Solirubrobacteraceae bacterium]
MIAVWRAEPHEAEVVARLIVAFRDHLGLDWPSANAFLAGVERLIEDRDSAFLLGAPNEDAPPAGVAQVRFRYGLWWAAEDCLLEDLFVREDARNSGVGRALVQGVVDLARERGCRRIELDVNEANAAALAVYESFGFSAQDDRYGGRNLLMRLHLEPTP